MTSQFGSQVLLKVGDGVTPTETFATIGGLKNTSMNFRGSSVDVTNKLNGSWQALGAGMGKHLVSVSGDGQFTDSASEHTIRSMAFACSINNFELHFGSGDVLSGAFKIASYTRSGPNIEEEEYRLTLESSGEITYTQA